jgi:dTDP-glucose 4,6-dehydratase
MNWQGKRVLITGAGGFIGSHLCERLVRQGATVRAFAHYNALQSAGWLDTSALRQEMQVLFGDIRDADSVRGAVQGVEVVFHLAALIAIPYSYKAPASYVETNINGTLNVLQAALHHGVGRVVHTSTSEVYGTARLAPIPESHPLQAQSPYAATKIAADKLAESFHRSFGLSVATIRPFNTFGPRQSARAVIPTIISQVLSGPVVRIGNLKPTRDLNFVADTVEGFLAIAVAPQAVGCATNIGSGRETSIGDLVALIARLCRREIQVETDDQRLRPDASEVMRLLADNTLAARTTGWRPRTSLEEGLRQTIDWCQSELGRFKPHEHTV